MRKKIRRCALLLALQETNEGGLSSTILDEVLPEWKDDIVVLRDAKISINVENGIVSLVTPIAFTLYHSVPPEIRNEVKDLLYRIIKKKDMVNPDEIREIFYRIDPQRLDEFLTDKKIISDASYEVSSSASQSTLKCIHCADAPCYTYAESDTFGSTDKFPTRVCPDDLIKKETDGHISIQVEQCTGCMICILRCPLDAISWKDGVAFKREYEENDSVKKLYVLPKMKESLTRETFQKIQELDQHLTCYGDIKDILNNFEKKVGRVHFNWDKDQYYPFIRNCFRALGLKVLYTGSGGKLKRSDVTIDDLFMVGIEVKSPAESGISKAAVRQAFDARLEVRKKNKHVYCAAIGQEFTRGVQQQAESYYKEHEISIPLLTGRVILYLVLKHQDFPQSKQYDLTRLFSFVGQVWTKQIQQYFMDYFSIRIAALKKEVPPNELIENCPHPIKELLVEGNYEDAIALLEKQKEKISEEIERCFPPPRRRVRGSQHQFMDT